MKKNILIVVTVILGFIIINHVLSQPVNDVESTTPTPANEDLNLQFI